MTDRPSLALRVALAFFAALYAGYGAAPAAAQEPALQGSYALDPARSDDIARAIEEGTARLNFVKRPVARGRLRKTNDAYPTVRIETAASAISIALGAGAPIVAPASGEPVRWKREDGEVFQVWTAWHDGLLRQTFLAEDGQRENLFTLERDGSTLRMRVTITSNQLPAPIVYTLVYQRTS